MTNNNKTENKMSEERAVILCTDKRGVFFGYTSEPFNREA